MGHPDDFVLDVIAHALGSTRSSRLYRRLVLEEQQATYVSTVNEPRFDPGIFWVVLELREGADPVAVESMVREEISELCRKGVRVPDLRRIRVQLRSSFLFEDETVQDVAMKIGRFEALTETGYPMLKDVLETYAGIDRSQIVEVAKRYLSPANCTVAWSVPEEKGDPWRHNGSKGSRPRKNR